MKNLFSSSSILVTGVFLLTFSLQSHESNSQSSLKYVTPLGDGSTESTTTIINKKAVKSFNRNYPTSASVKWFDSGDLLEAYFVENGKQNRVYYRPKGTWFRTLTSYNESLLNSDIKSLVSENFKNYEITNVTEVHEGIMTCYFINIEAAKDFKQVIVYEGEIWVHKQFRKQ